MIAEPFAQPTAAEVVDALRARGHTLAVAESLTGGLLASAFVAVPGASDVFRGGLVVYATDLKHTWADVPSDLLAERGPVDPEVATALARGVRARAGANWALATTGVAGPEPVGDHAVGEVWIGVSGPDGEHAIAATIAGDRSTIRSGAVIAAVEVLKVRLGLIEKGTRPVDR